MHPDYEVWTWQCHSYSETERNGIFATTCTKVHSNEMSRIKILKYHALLRLLCLQNLYEDGDILAI